MEKQIEKIINGNKCSDALQKFVDGTLQTFIFPELKDVDKRKELWNAIYNLATTSTDPAIIKNCFIAIRILSREKQCLVDLITDEWLELAKKYSGLGAYNETNIALIVEVEKALCNLCFNSQKAAEKCTQNGILQGLTKRIQLENANKEILFFDVKLIFLLTALCTSIRANVRRDLNGVRSLIKILANVLEETTLNANKIQESNINLVCEVLKALFNITINSYGIKDPEEEAESVDLMIILRNYLVLDASNKQELTKNVIHLLTNMPSFNFDYLAPKIGDEIVAEKYKYEDRDMTAIFEILEFLQERFLEDQTLTHPQEALSPIISLLWKCADNNRYIRKYLKTQILPPLRDVHSRPEEGTTLRNNLCKLLTSPITQLREFVSELLFILCKKNVNRMIKYTGYGNAAGLFAKRGLLGGKADAERADFSSDSQDSETEEYAEFKHGINPVTGRYEAARPSPMKDMTEEQKEYEAMQLVQLMDSMTKCGTIQPCRIGPDGRPQPIEHVLQLQEGLKSQRINKNDSDSD